MKVAIAGGGWAGLAAAVSLAGQHNVTLFEAAPTLGGRARRVQHAGLNTDNGQHILLGAYQATLTLLQQLNVAPNSVLHRLPLQLVYTDGFRFAAPTLPLPAPWHLLAALLGCRGLSWRDKWQIGKRLRHAQSQAWQCVPHLTVAQWLADDPPSPHVMQRIWVPLCLSALNTPIKLASAQVFLNVLRDSLGARRHASDMLIPRKDLSTLLPDQAHDWLTERGHSVQTREALRAFQASQEGWHVQTNQSDYVFDALILATPAWETARLVAHWQPQHPSLPALQAMQYLPITTVYLRYDDQRELGQHFYALTEQADRQHYGQFVFDRYAATKQKEDQGLMAVVISASQHLDIDRTTLAQQVHQQLCEACGWNPNIIPVWQTVITEKRATFACVPERPLPSVKLAPYLFLAGDYLVADYPATLEAAVRSGQHVSRLLA